MHDPSLEQKLRAVLQAEGDALPLTITASELERRLALRRRGGLGPLASLGLAAAVGAGLVGLAGVAGGWFERQPEVSPSPNQMGVTSPVASEPAPSSSSSSIVLPSLDELVAPIDEGTIVRAQSVGSADGSVSVTPVGPRSVTFAPLAEAGAYHLWTACLTSDDVEVWVIPADGVEPREQIPVTCDASISRRDVGIEAGDTVSVRSGGPSSWRVVVQAPDSRLAPHEVDAIAPVRPQDPTDEIHLDAHSDVAQPTYGDISTGGGIFVPQDFGSIAQREDYRVSFSCAGPRPIRYAFVASEDSTPAGSEPVEYHATQVDCDGALHEDILRLPQLNPVRLFVTADARNAWHVIVSSTAPPITAAKNENGWVMSSAYGPNYDTSGSGVELSLVGNDTGGATRVVVSCFGDGSISGSIGVGLHEGDPVDPFTLDCNVEHTTSVTLARTYPDAGQVHVIYDPHGSKVWIAVTIQIRDSATPAP